MPNASRASGSARASCTPVGGAPRSDLDTGGEPQAAAFHRRDDETCLGIAHGHVQRRARGPVMHVIARFARSGIR